MSSEAKSLYSTACRAGKYIPGEKLNGFQTGRRSLGPLAARFRKISGIICTSKKVRIRVRDEATKRLMLISPFKFPKNRGGKFRNRGS